MSPRGTTLTPQPAHPADLRPVRVCDHVFQAEAFLALFHRCGASADLEPQFERWADRKYFWPADRLVIARRVRRLLAQGRRNGIPST